MRRQSEHLDDYRAALARLEAQGLLYPSFESRAEIAALVAERERARRRGRAIRTARRSIRATRKSMSPAERERRIAAGEPLRAAARHGGSHRARRRARVDGNRAGAAAARPAPCAAAPAAWGDVVLARKETPTSYHLAVVVDDALQGVTDVVRGQDLFCATSVHRLLQTLLGLPAPAYHHHRLILDADGRKLSKSTQATGLRELRAQGATPADIRRMVGTWSLTRFCSAARRGMSGAGWGQWPRHDEKPSATRRTRRPKRGRKRAPQLSRARHRDDAGRARARDQDAADRHPGARRAAGDRRSSRRASANGRSAIKSTAEHLAMLTSLIVDAVRADAARPGAAPRPDPAAAPCAQSLGGVARRPRPDARISNARSRSRRIFRRS